VTMSANSVLTMGNIVSLSPVGERQRTKRMTT
jgi:hypothetical protein